MKRYWTMLAALLAAFVIGLHWPALQVTAWTAMTVKNARHMSLGNAIVKAMRGDRPCVVCQLIRKSHQFEQERRDTLHLEQLEGIQQTTRYLLQSFLIFRAHVLPTGTLIHWHSPPSLPPPQVA